MVSGPSKETKRHSSYSDQSHEIADHWTDIFHHSLIIALIAIVVWGLCSLMRWSVSVGFETLFEPFLEHHLTASELTTHFGYLIAILLGGAFVRGLIIQHKGWKNAEGDGVSQSLAYFHETYDQGEKAIVSRFQKPTFLEAIKRMIMTSLTISTGGSGGLEAPVIPVGECTASGWSKFFNVKKMDNIRAYQMVGISAAVTTLLNAPLASALFAAEILYADRIIYRSFIFSLLGSMIAYVLNNHFLNFPPLFEAPIHSDMYTLDEYAKVILVSIVFCAPAALGLNLLFRWLKDKISVIPSLWRAFVGALGSAGIVYIYWRYLNIAPHHLLGVGEESLAQVLNQTTPEHMHVWWVLALVVLGKAMTTGLTLMAGGSAGLLVPAMVLGGTTGAAVFEFLQTMGWAHSSELSLFVISGIAASLVSVIDVPIAAIALVMEIFGSHYGPAAIVASVLCYLIAKRLHLYQSQGVVATDKT